MDQSIFIKIHNTRNLNRQKQIKDKLSHSRDIREHEFAHARIAGSFVDEIKFFTQKDLNNIEYIVHGVVFLDTKMTKSKSFNIEKLERLIKASEAPKDMSNQDKKMRAFLQSQLTKQKQAR